MSIYYQKLLLQQKPRSGAGASEIKINIKFYEWTGVPDLLTSTGTVDLHPNLDLPKAAKGYRNFLRLKWLKMV